MFIRSIVIGGALSLAATFAYGADAVGFHQTALVRTGPRPLPLTLWYPTKETAPVIIAGENPAFKGNAVINDASPEPGAHSLVVLSHGFGGSWRNLSWLASTLVAQGYIVAAGDHPGTTTFNRDPSQAAQLWERPHDISRIIDALEANPKWAGEVDMGRIAAVGHSLGGWTVSALAGARVKAALYEKDCEDNVSPATCGVSAKLGLTNPELERDMSDERISAFVSLDLGGARGFTPESLSAIDKPFLVLGAGVNTAHLPSEKESGYLADYLPKGTSTYATISDATHFSFMQLCKPGAVELIEKEDPGDGIVCEDGGARSREDIHADIAARITAFLAASIPVN